MPELPRTSWPAELLDFDVVEGIFVGGCISQGDGATAFTESGGFSATAHAHTSGSHAGWLCFRSADALKCRELVIHELAHLTTGRGHDEIWRAEVLRLGGSLAEVSGFLGSYVDGAGPRRRMNILRNRPTSITRALMHLVLRCGWAMK